MDLQFGPNAVAGHVPVREIPCRDPILVTLNGDSDLTLIFWNRGGRQSGCDRAADALTLELKVSDLDLGDALPVA